MPPSGKFQPKLGDQGAVTDLESQALPLAGAFTQQSFVDLPGFLRRVSWIAKITGAAGSANSQVRFQVQWRMGGMDPTQAGYESVVNGQASVTIVSSQFARMPIYAAELIAPIVAAAASLTLRLFTLEVPPGATGVRMIAAELTDTTHPAIVETFVFGSSEI